MKFLKNRLVLLGLFVALAFLFIATFTMKDYGINWDEPFHFQRGQAYLHYFLTGKTNFLDLPLYPQLKGSSDFVSLKGESELFDKAIKSKQTNNSNIRRSYFASDVYNFEYFVKNDEGHPPISDIFAAGFNYLLYQKLGIMGDLESYHFYEIFLSSVLVLAVFIFVTKKLGVVPALISSISLASYPLFFSESHFNIKDPPEAALFGLTLILFYFGIEKNNWKILLASAVFAGFALGTKLNLLFSVLVIGPWLVFVVYREIFLKRKRFGSLKKIWPLLIVLLFYIPVVLGVTYILWPFLWHDPMGGAMKVLGFYEQIGTGTPGEMSKFIVHGWNTYPTLWIIYTTQVPILFLSMFGLLASLFIFLRRRDGFYLFVVLWFLIPVIRASYPNAGIYGGVRQIMEFVPAMAILAGIGAKALADSLRNKKFAYAVMFLGLAFSVYEMAKIHPNENVYFNQIVGGIRGARDKNIPYWGNTYGNVYMQGVNWLNKNAEPNAKLGLPIANMINVPRLKLRSDIDFSNAYWSGTNRAGEYEMEMDFEWPPKYWYSFQYYDKYLEPVYIASVDGVPLLKVWKNDLAHTRPEFKEEAQYKPKSINFEKNATGFQLKIDMGKQVYLTGIKIKHGNFQCQNAKPGYVAILSDGGKWVQEPDPINTPQVPITATGWTDNNFVFLFPGRKAQIFLVDPQVGNACIFQNAEISITGLKKLP